MVSGRRLQSFRRRPAEYALAVFAVIVLVTGTVTTKAIADTTTTTTVSATTTTTVTATTIPPATTTTTVPRTVAYSVGITRCTFMDATRNLRDFATSPPSVLAHDRTLVTEIRYPTTLEPSTTRELNNATPATKSGGFPTIVFAHGYDVTPDTYAKLLDAWVRKGFVVIAPVFPGEEPAEVARQRVNTEADLYNEPADMTFVIRHLLRDDTVRNGACPLVAGLIDPTRLALAGHSDGAIAVGLLAFSTGRDPQGVAYRTLRSGLNIRSVLVMSGAEDGRARYSSTATRSPLLVIQSARDQCNPSFYGLQIYRDIHQNNKWFLELLTAHHLPPIDGDDAAAFSVVAPVTTSYLEFTLNGAPPLSVVVAAGDARPTIARIFHGGNGPYIAPFDDPPACGPH
jgi:hypothetical protein